MNIKSITFAVFIISVLTSCTNSTDFVEGANDNDTYKVSREDDLRYNEDALEDKNTKNRYEGRWKLYGETPPECPKGLYLTITKRAGVEEYDVKAIVAGRADSVLRWGLYEYNAERNTIMNITGLREDIRYLGDVDHIILGHLSPYIHEENIEFQRM